MKASVFLRYIGLQYSSSNFYILEITMLSADAKKRSFFRSTKDNDLDRCLCLYLSSVYICLFLGLLCTLNSSVSGHLEASELQPEKMDIPPIVRNDFIYRDTLFVNISEGKRHPRASASELRGLLLQQRAKYPKTK